MKARVVSGERKVEFEITLQITMTESEIAEAATHYRLGITADERFAAQICRATDTIYVEAEAALGYKLN